MPALLLFLLFGSACASTAPSGLNPTDLVSCVEQPSIHPIRSAELQELYRADQADREGPMDEIDWERLKKRDLARRGRVAEIFAEGCFIDAKDYANAAMIYQHGQTADHTYQTFIWAKKAVDLGDESSKWLLAAGLDRYLVSIGQKQLFATQASKGHESSCWCLEPVEPSVPEKMRVDYTKKTLQTQFDWIKKMNGSQPACRSDRFCDRRLKDSPKGTVPGFW